MNIKNLKKVIITGKGFRATREAPADEKHRVTLYGYLDSKINSWNEMEVTERTTYLNSETVVMTIYLQHVILQRH